jgi:hypothetical protein
MRTTIRIQDELLKRAKRDALVRRCTLGNVIEDALRKELWGDGGRAVERGKTRLPTYGGDGVRPGVNLDSSADLLDLMALE